MKNLLCSILVLFALVVLVGCGTNKAPEKPNEGTTSSENKSLDHEVYKYMKIQAESGDQLYMHSYSFFGDLWTVGSDDKEYKPELIVEFDTKTGKAVNVKMYAFFLDGEDDNWVNISLQKYNSSSGQKKSEISNVKKGRVNEYVSYLECSIDPESHSYDQYINSLFYEQDIEKYKDKVYFSNLDNYSTIPPHEEGANFFEDSLSMFRIEWSNSAIKAY